MKIAHDISAMNQNRIWNMVGGDNQKSAEKLASGYQINRSADDAAGLSISEKMRKQIRGINRASANAQDGISLIQTAEGALDEVHEILHRMNELAVQGANGTNSEIDRSYMQDEVNQLKTEVDRIATTVKFNDTYLLDGSLADPTKVGEVEQTYQKHMEVAERGWSVTALNGSDVGKILSLDEIKKKEGLKIVYTEVVYDVETVQTTVGSSTASGLDNLKQALQKQMVPQAVQSLIDTYPDTFGYLNGSTIGIGLNLYSDGSSTLAYVAMGISGTLDDPLLSYQLAVNTRTLQLDSSGNMPEQKRKDLEVTIVHEMMHAMMDEALTTGMLGMVGTSANPSEKFPLWFVEGMAQSAAGACYDGNDWINGGFGLTESSSLSDIATQINRNKLTGNSNDVNYGTGYLACMYLGYLASGGRSASESAVAAGLDKILSDIKGGKSLDAAIKDNTSYNGVSDFQNKFGDTASCQFVKSLLGEVQSGSGGLAAGDYTKDDLLPNRNLDISLFELNITNDRVQNKYPAGYTVLSGGTTTGSGTAGPTGSGTGGSGTGGGGSTIDTSGDSGTSRPIGTSVSSDLLRGGLRLQVGADSGQQMTLYIEGMNCNQIGIQNVNVRTQDSATAAIDQIAFAIEQVSAQRSSLGAYQNRLEHTIRNLDNVAENTQAAESRIRDTDMAKEMVRFTNLQILQQAGQAMMAQQRQSRGSVLQLLG